MAEYPRAELAGSGGGKFWAGGVFSVPGKFSTVWSDSDLAGKYFLSGGAPWILVIEIPVEMSSKCQQDYTREVKIITGF